MRILASLLLAITMPLSAQTPPQTVPAADPLAPLYFLLGTWSAKTNTAGSANASALGSYAFARDLNGHALQRTGSLDQCKGPKGFDCQHHDQLTIFADAHALAAHHASLLALFLDSEVHVIYYAISTPDAHTAIFDSQSPPSAPKFRLSYHLEGGVMTGTFAMAAPGSSEYHPYLEWSGTKQ